MKEALTESNHRLSQHEIDHYHRAGYVIPQYRLPENVLDRMVREYESLLSRHPELDENFIPSPHVPNYTPGVTDCEPWLDFARIPEVLDIVEQLIGSDFLMWGSAVFGKPASSGKVTPMHQDGEYWPIRPLASATVWIAIDAATPKNGCMQVVPRSHSAKELYQHRRNDSADYTLNQVLEMPASAAGEVADIVLEPGQFSIHDVYLIHGSRSNTSGARRAGLTYRYMPTSSHFDHQWAAEMTRTMGTTDLSERPLFLMRGHDRCHKNDLRIGHV